MKLLGEDDDDTVTDLLLKAPQAEADDPGDKVSAMDVDGDKGGERVADGEHGTGKSVPFEYSFDNAH